MGYELRNCSVLLAVREYSITQLSRGTRPRLNRLVVLDQQITQRMPMLVTVWYRLMELLLYR
jgi:hypothetical protein